MIGKNTMMMKENKLKKVSSYKQEEKMHSTYELAMRYAYSGGYEKAIELFKTLKGNRDALNDIGVSYERLKNYEKAYEYYKKADTLLSLGNILALYNTKKIPMNVTEYETICDKLIEYGYYDAYVYLSKLYAKGHPEVPENGELALKYAKEGYELFPNQISIIFNYAWCLCLYAKKEEEKELSHKLFEGMLFVDRKEDREISTVAKYNFAYQLENGIGCDKDIDRAIYWYIKAFEEHFDNAALALAYIYQSYEGYINEDAANFWKEQYDENCGEA